MLTGGENGCRIFIICIALLLESLMRFYLQLASGLPIRNEQRHAREICACAVEVRAAFAETFSLTKLQVKIGVHSGNF
jgi:hypothetical protein